MDDRRRAPLPWDHKVAIGCLALLALQALQEFCFQGKGLGLATLGPLSLFLFLIVSGVGIAVLKGHRAVWWWGAALLGGTGLLLVGAYWDPVWSGLGMGDRMQRIATVTEYEWISRPSLDRFGLFWVLARIVMLLVAAMLLILGQVRRKLRSG